MPAHVVHSSPALTVVDYRCTAEAKARPFVEVHRGYSIAYVRSGSFGYTSRGRRYDLVAGALLVGHPEDEYVCSHEHVGGDECLAIELAPALVDELGATSLFRVGRVPPVPELMVLGERAQAAARGDYVVGVDEAALGLASRFVEVAGDGAVPRAQPVDRRRAVEAALYLEARSSEDVALADVAAHVGLSSFHFLRLFSSVVGATPHQYLVRCRLRRAARMLCEEDRSIASIAFDAGFRDVSNFVRTFRRAAGVSPKRFRTSRSKILQER